MIRLDLSDKLIHLIKGATAAEALATFDQIIRDGALRGGNGTIKGPWRCVCFTETPLANLAQALSLRSAQPLRYFPAGIMVSKQWLFERGGRPVIYQPDDDYEKLHADLKWRHVRYDLSDFAPVDFTWEREWRIRTDWLPFGPGEVTLVCPTRAWIDRLIDPHTARINREIEEIAMSMGGEQAAHYAVKKFPWYYLVLEDLGVPMRDEVRLV